MHRCFYFIRCFQNFQSNFSGMIMKVGKLCFQSSISKEQN